MGWKKTKTFLLRNIVVLAFLDKSFVLINLSSSLPNFFSSNFFWHHSFKNKAELSNSAGVGVGGEGI